MSISFKINKLNDSSNKPTVFERLGMKSSKTNICASYLKTGYCETGPKCPYDHTKKSTEESTGKRSNDVLKTGTNKKADFKSKKSSTKHSLADDVSAADVKSDKKSEGKSNKEKEKKDALNEKNVESPSKMKRRSDGKSEERNKLKAIDKAKKEKEKAERESKVSEDKHKDDGRKRREEERMKKKRKHSSTSSRSSSGSSRRRARSGHKKGRSGHSCNKREEGRKDSSDRRKQHKKKSSPPSNRSKPPSLFKPPSSQSPHHNNHQSLSRKDPTGEEALRLDFYEGHKTSMEVRQEERGPYKAHNNEEEYYRVKKDEKGGGMRMSRKDGWQRRQEGEERDEGSAYRGKQKWSDDGFSPRGSGSKDLGSKERSLMDSCRINKGPRGSEERYREADSYRAFRHDRPASRGSPPVFGRSKKDFADGDRERDREGYQSSDESNRNFEHSGRRNEGFMGSLRRSRSKSSVGSRNATRFFEKPSMMPRGRPNAGPPLLHPPHHPSIQALPPPPSSYDFPFSMPHPPMHNDPNKLINIAKAGMRHGGPDFWDGGRRVGGMLSGMPNPQFRGSMPPFRPTMHHMPPMQDFRMETRMPAPPSMNATFPNAIHASRPLLEDFKARKALNKPPFVHPYNHPHNLLLKPNEAKAEKAPVMEVERDAWKGLRLACYEDVSGDELVDGEENKEETVADVDDADIDYLSLPTNIATVEKTDVNWSSLVAVSLKANDSTLETTLTNPFDQIGLSRRLAGEELYKEMTNLKIKSQIKNKHPTDEIKATENKESDSIIVNGDIKKVVVNESIDKDAINNDGFLDDVALYHVYAWKRKARVQGVGALMADLDQALYARKDLLVRRILCGLDKEEELIYPQQSHRSDIYKEAVNLFKATSVV